MAVGFVLCLVLAGMQTAVAEDWSRIVSLGVSSGNMGVRLPGSVNAAPGLVPAELIDSLYYPERDNGITRQAEDGKVTYWVDKDSASKIGSSNIQTILKLPEGTVSVICTDESGNVYSDQSPWFDYTSGESQMLLNIQHKQGEISWKAFPAFAPSTSFWIKTGIFWRAAANWKFTVFAQTTAKSVWII